MALKTRKAPQKSKAPDPTPAKAVAAPAKAPARALTPFEEMDLLFDRLSRGFLSRIGLPAHGESAWPSMINAPKVDLIDRGNELVVRAEIPGVAKDDLKISLTDQSVTIRGETHKETKEEKGDYHRREISRGSFQRTLALPAEVAGDKAKASFKDGVLELVLPKVDRPRARSVRIE
jgi:HSP20 family protein